MSDVDKFATILSDKGYSFFHFTDTRNLVSIGSMAFCQCNSFANAAS